jgi:hypothetical protein
MGEVSMDEIAPYSSIRVFFKPGLRGSSLKLVRSLGEQLGVDALFLDLPRSLEAIIRGLEEGDMSYEEALREMERRRLLPEPINSWIYTHEPLIRGLPRLRYGENFKIYCYKDTKALFHLAKIATDIACLTLRCSVTGRVDVEEWMELLREAAHERWDALEDEVFYISKRAVGARSICLSGIDGRSLAERLRVEGFKVELRSVEDTYYYTPLEILEGLLERGGAGEEEVERLVKCQVEYIRDYVVRSRNRDEAYYRWRHDKIPLSLQGDLGEMEFLGRISAS